MDENLASLMLYGFKLAKDMEQNLPMWANQPDILLLSCEEILRVFGNVRERLMISQTQMTQEVLLQHEEPRDHRRAGVQEWLRTGGVAATTAVGREPMDLLNARANIGDESGNKMKGIITTTAAASSGVEFRMGGETKPSANAPDSSKTSSSSSQRRRSYYRCTHQKFYGCPAKKQVQRLEDDPFTFEVTYRGSHTCHVPSSAAVPPSPTAPIISFSPSLPNTTHWLSMQLLRDLAAPPPAGGGAGPSSTGGGFPDYQLPVADMADAMFNSGSSSSNSMDIIFSEEKKD